MHSCPPAQVRTVESSFPAPGLPCASGRAGTGAGGGQGMLVPAGGPPGAGIKPKLPFELQARGSSWCLLLQRGTAPGRGTLPVLPCRAKPSSGGFAGPLLPGKLRERQRRRDPPVCIPRAGGGARGGCGREPPARGRLSQLGSGRDARKQANQIIHS